MGETEVGRMAYYVIPVTIWVYAICWPYNGAFLLIRIVFNAALNNNSLKSYILFVYITNNTSFIFRKTDASVVMLTPQPWASRRKSMTTILKVFSMSRPGLLLARRSLYKLYHGHDTMIRLGHGMWASMHINWPSDIMVRLGQGMWASTHINWPSEIMVRFGQSMWASTHINWPSDIP